MPASWALRAPVLLLAALSVIFSACGYKLTGYGGQIPENIRTILISDFDNKTPHADIERFVTFAVKDEFLKRSKLKPVQSVEVADSRLEGAIISFQVSPQSITGEGSANVYRLQIVLSVRLIDLTSNKILFDSQNVSFSDTYDYDSSTPDDPSTDFFSQESSKLRDISSRFAESIVTTILENF